MPRHASTQKSSDLDRNMSFPLAHFPAFMLTMGREQSLTLLPVRGHRSHPAPAGSRRAKPLVVFPAGDDADRGHVPRHGDGPARTGRQNLRDPNLRDPNRRDPNLRDPNERHRDCPGFPGARHCADLSLRPGQSPSGRHPGPSRPHPYHPARSPVPEGQAPSSETLGKTGRSTFAPQPAACLARHLPARSPAFGDPQKFGPIEASVLACPFCYDIKMKVFRRGRPPVPPPVPGR